MTTACVLIMVFVLGFIAGAWAENGACRRYYSRRNH